MMTLVVEFHSNCASQLCLVSKEIDEAWVIRMPASTHMLMCSLLCDMRSLRSGDSLASLQPRDLYSKEGNTKRLGVDLPICHLACSQ